MKAVALVVALAACGGSNDAPRWTRTLDASAVRFEGEDIVFVSNSIVSRLRASDGATVWSIPITGRSIGISDMVIAPDGSIVLCGTFEGSADFAGTVLDESSAITGEEGFVASLSPDGPLRWVTPVSDTMLSIPRNVAVGRDGTIATTGQAAGAFAADFDADGTERWIHFGSPTDAPWGEGIAVAADGGVVAGLPPSAVRLSPSGDMEWAVPFPGNGPTQIFSESNGDTLALGDGAFHRIDANGNAGAFGSMREDVIPGTIAIGSDDLVYIGGGDDWLTISSYTPDAALVDVRVLPVAPGGFAISDDHAIFAGDSYFDP